jgi:hypothetical protein
MRGIAPGQRRRIRECMQASLERLLVFLTEVQPRLHRMRRAQPISIRPASTHAGYLAGPIDYS